MTTKTLKEKLTILEATERKKALTNNYGLYRINYSVILSLRKSDHLHTSYSDSKLQFEGISKINFYYHMLPQSSKYLLIDFHGIVKSVIVNGQQAKHSYSTGKILIDKHYLIDCSDNIIEVLYCAKYNNSGVGLHHFIDPLDQKEYLYTQFEAYDCNLAIPAFDQPNLKARLNLTLITPNHWEALSNEYPIETSYLINKNGEYSSLAKRILYSTSSYDSKDYIICAEDHLFKSIKDKNYKITIFHQTAKLSPYLYALAAGPYHCLENAHSFRIPMKVYLRQSLKNNGNPKLLMEMTMAGVNFYEKYFGVKFPFSKYDQIYVPEYNFGAMENPGLVTYNEAYAWKGAPLFARESRFCVTALHELAHMWFGNLVTMDWWDDLWLNEAFATFISYLACSISLELDPRYRETAWISFNKDKSFGYTEDSKKTTHSVYSQIKDTDESQSNFDGIVYYKGSSILKQLYYFVGHDNFSKGLNSYFNKHSWNNTKYYDFVSEMIIASENLSKSEFYDSGETSFNKEFYNLSINGNNSSNNLSNKSNSLNLDLATLVDSWLKKVGLTSIEVEIFSEDNNQTISKFNIVQKPILDEHKNLQTHMIDILLIYDNHLTETVKRVIVHPRDITTIYSFKNKRYPAAVVLNHNDWAYVKWIIDDNTFQYVKCNYIKMKSIDRSMATRSMFNKARDALISSYSFLNAVADFIKQEEDSVLLLQLLSYVNAIVHYYTPLNKVGKVCDEMLSLLQMKFYDLIKKINNLINYNASNLNSNNNDINTINNNKEVSKLEDLSRNVLTIMLGLCVEDNNRDTIYNMLITNKFKDEDLPQTILTKDLKYSAIKVIYASKKIKLDLKKDLLENEIKKDCYSDLSLRAQCSCKAALPDKSSKKEVWKIITEDNEESLYTKIAYMSNFIVYDQLDIVKDYLKEPFFEAGLKLAEKNNYHLTSAFFSYMAPNYLAGDENIYNLLLKYTYKSDNHDYVKNMKKLDDDLIRFKKAQVLG